MATEIAQDVSFTLEKILTQDTHSLKLHLASVDGADRGMSHFGDESSSKVVGLIC